MSGVFDFDGNGEMNCFESAAEAMYLDDSDSGSGVGNDMSWADENYPEDCEYYDNCYNDYDCENCGHREEW